MRGRFHDPGTLWDPRTMGQALVFLRIKAQLTRDEAARRSEISTGTLSRYENEGTSRIDAAAIARHCEMLSDANGYRCEDVWEALRPLLAKRAASSAVLHAATEIITKPARRRRRLT